VSPYIKYWKSVSPKERVGLPRTSEKKLQLDASGLKAYLEKITGEESVEGGLTTLIGMIGNSRKFESLSKGHTVTYLEKDKLKALLDEVIEYRKEIPSHMSAQLLEGCEADSRALQESFMLLVADSVLRFMANDFEEALKSFQLAYKVDATMRLVPLPKARLRSSTYNLGVILKVLTAMLENQPDGCQKVLNMPEYKELKVRDLSKEFVAYISSSIEFDVNYHTVFDSTSEAYEPDLSSKYERYVDEVSRCGLVVNQKRAEDLTLDSVRKVQLFKDEYVNVLLRDFQLKFETFLYQECMIDTFVAYLDVITVYRKNAGYPKSYVWTGNDTDFGGGVVYKYKHGRPILYTYGRNGVDDGGDGGLEINDKDWVKFLSVNSKK